MCAPDAIQAKKAENAPSEKEALTSSVPFATDKGIENDSTRDLTRGVRYGTASLAFLFVAITVTMPFMQSQRDALGCDTLCVGSMTSIRSMLTLTGATLVGKVSDSTIFQHYGGARRICLFVGVVASTIGLLMGFNATNIRMLFASMIPGSLLQQNGDVFKALFSAYHDAVPEKSSSTDRAASAGLLGMAVGLAIMAGPMAGAYIFSSYEQATYFGMVCVLISAFLIMMMPSPRSNIQKQQSTDAAEKKKGIFSSFDIPAARTPAALFLMAARICMALAFHIFQTIWTASLKERFDFGPKDYGSFFSFIGLTYAVSQGFLAKALLKFAGGHTAKGRVRLLLACCTCLGCGRYLAFQTTSLPVVYCLFGGIVTALGLINTMFSADASQIAPPDEIGALFGVLAAVESAAGMGGPLVGGALSYIHPIKAPLFAVLALYAFVFILVFFGYESLVLKNSHEFQKKKGDEDETLLKKEN